jgi:hypothetical protein
VEQRLLTAKVERLKSSVGRAFVRVVNSLILNMSEETRLKIAGVDLTGRRRSWTVTFFEVSDFSQ